MGFSKMHFFSINCIYDHTLINFYQSTMQVVKKNVKQSKIAYGLLKSLKKRPCKIAAV